jgi:hypothetical protein
MRTRRLKLTSLALMTGIAASGVIASGTFDRVDAVTINLYDGSSGVTPNNVANPYLAFAGPGNTQSASGGVTTLNTSANQQILAGYSNYNPNLTSFVNPLFPILNRNTGYTLSFTMKLNSQTNNNPNRAGFNALILGSDKKGIELGFKQSDIFAYNNSANLQSGERSTTLSGLISTLNTYNLNILGNNYTLKNNGNTLLTGLLRDYTGVVNPNTPATSVYGTSNFLFLGDDRTTAGASVDIKNISLTTANTPVPEPSSMAGVAVAIGCGAMFKRKLRKADKLVLAVKK